MGRCESVTPPPSTGLEVLSRESGGVAGIAVVNQVHPAQLVMSTLEPLQLPDIVRRIFRVNARRFHAAAVNDQEVQDVDCPMPRVLELLLFDRARDRTADRVAFQDLMVGHLIGADHPIAQFGQARGVGVAPEDLLRPLLELEIQVSCPPVASPVGLQINVVQDPADSPRTDGRNNAVGDDLTGQVLAGPVGDVQALGYGFQAGQFNDLSTLQGGKSRSGVPTAGLTPGGRIAPGVRSGGRCDGRSTRRTASGRPRFESGIRRRFPKGCGRAGLETKARSGCERSVEGPTDRPRRSRSHAVFDHAWGELLAEKRLDSQHNSCPRISGITYGQTH
jgi:hypothetical protein